MPTDCRLFHVRRRPQDWAEPPGLQRLVRDIRTITDSLGDGVKRIYDAENQVLIYLAHANELSEGSAKMSISTVPVRQFAPAAQ